MYVLFLLQYTLILLLFKMFVNTLPVAIQTGKLYRIMNWKENSCTQWGEPQRERQYSSLTEEIRSLRLFLYHDTKIG